MSFVPDRIKLTAKSSNYAAVARFSSTLDDAYVVLVANNCNNYFYNDQNNASIIGAQSSNDNSGISYETYIGTKKNDIISKIARFNSETINLDTNTIVRGNIVPSNNIVYDLGTNQNRWRELYLSGNSIYLNNSLISTENDTIKFTNSNNENIQISTGTVNLQTVGSDSNVILTTNNNGLFANIYNAENILIKSVNITDKSTDALAEGPSNLFYTPERFDERLASKTLDNIINGSSNKYIVNDIYDSDLQINGTLRTSNLIVIGDTTTITTTTYETENLEIISSALDGPSLLISQSGDGTNNLFTASLNDEDFMVIKGSGNVGIGVSDPVSKLQVDGVVTASVFDGDGSNLFNVNLSDRTTSMLAEGSNLYYTAERVGAIVSSSNLETSNYIHNTSNELANTLQSTSNVISSRITDADLAMSNYVNNTSNELGNTIQSTSNVISYRITDVDLAMSNYVNNTSNELANTLQSTSNVISYRITDADLAVSNYVTNTSNELGNTMQSTSNVISSRITDADLAMSNYVNNTSNELANTLQSTSNIISERITSLNTVSGDATSNYINNTSNELANTLQSTSNIISNRITNLNADMIADGTSHRFIINDIYDTDLTIVGTLTTSNLNVIGITTTIETSTYKTENLEIASVAVDGPSLLISQTGDGTNNLFTATLNNDEFMVIKGSGNVGIGVSDPVSKLQVDGTITALVFDGDGSNLFNVNLSDRTTSMLAEGSNLYYTAERVGAIVSSSNLETSNYIHNTSNELGNTIQSTSNVISERITDIYIDSSNYILSTSNMISLRISDLNTDLVSEGIHNRYIIDNVYDHDMTITGKLTVSMLEVTDLDVVYESNGATTNTDLITYINNTTSNVIDARLLQLTNTIASLTARIEALENA
jgi:gas vesicle protein